MVGVFLLLCSALFIYLFVSTLRERGVIAKAVQHEEQRKQDFLSFLHKVRLTALKRN
jgi:hypothetical protein